MCRVSKCGKATTVGDCTAQMVSITSSSEIDLGSPELSNLKADILLMMLSYSDVVGTMVMLDDAAEEREGFVVHEVEHAEKVVEDDVVCRHNWRTKTRVMGYEMHKSAPAMHTYIREHCGTVP